MLNFLKRKNTPETSSEAQALVNQLAKEDGRIYPFKLKNFPAGEKILKSEPEIQKQVALLLIDWTENNRPPTGHGHRTEWQRHWRMQNTLLDMLKRKLPFTEGDLLYILDWSIRKNTNIIYIRKFSIKNRCR